MRDDVLSKRHHALSAAYPGIAASDAACRAAKAFSESSGCIRSVTGAAEMMSHLKMRQTVIARAARDGEHTDFTSINRRDAYQPIAVDHGLVCLNWANAPQSNQNVS